jgi:dTDP-4-dehydrorhamnose reductase
MKIGITGASGMLGSAIVSLISKSHQVLATSRSKGLDVKGVEWDCFDLTNFKLLNLWLEKSKPDMVIHCAAIVDINFCEDNIVLANALHVETTKIIANYLKTNNGRLIYISTDSVFDGKKKGYYNETDKANPLNVYAKTKLMGEKYTQLLERGLVLRTNIIGLKKKNNNSLVGWILQGLKNNIPLNLFHDVYFSPIAVDKLSLIIKKIIDNPIYGLYNCASRDSVSKYEFGKKMSEIFKLSDLKINRVSIDFMKFKATRPKNMALDISKISSDLSHDIPDVQDSIKFIKNQFDENYLRYK